MSDTYLVSLGGVPVRTGEPIATGSRWTLALGEDGLQGWRAAGDAAADTSDHWSGVGATPGSLKRAARQITLSGWILGEGPGAIEEGLDSLSYVTTTLVVGEPSRALVRTADVRVVQVQDSRISRGVSKVTLSLVADDPLRYSAESRPLANGAVLLPNRGDVTAFPRLALSGPHGSLTITHPGGTWSFPALASGSSRLVDFRELRVWNGNVRAFGEGSGPACRVPPGGSSWTVSGLGAGSAILSRAEAWS